MTTSAQQLIEAAYSRSTANDPGKLATDGELLGVANRIYHALFALAAAAAPERFLSTTTMTLSGTPGVGTLSTDIIDLRRVQTSGGTKVNVIPVEELDRTWHLAPAMYRRGLSLVSRNGSGDPVSGDTLTLFLLDAPTDLSALGSTIDPRFALRHVELIVVEMAMYLATKDTGRDAAEFAALKQFRDMQLEAFFRLSGLSMTALQSPHGGVIVQRLNQLMGGGSASGAQAQG